MADPRQSEISRLELLFAAHPEGRVFTHLAEAYRRAGEPERARVLLETGLARHADYASAHVVHGRVLLDLGREEEAEAAFRRVLGLDPENLVALRALGDLARRAGRAAEALSYYEQVRRRDPANPEVEEVVAALAAAAGAAAPVEAVAEVGVMVEAGAEDGDAAEAAGDRDGAGPAEAVVAGSETELPVAAAHEEEPAGVAAGHGAPAAGDPEPADDQPAPEAMDSQTTAAGDTAAPAAVDEVPAAQDEPGASPVWGDPTMAPAWEEPGAPPAWDEPAPLIAPEEPEVPPPPQESEDPAEPNPPEEATAAAASEPAAATAGQEPAEPDEARAPAASLAPSEPAAAAPATPTQDAVPADETALLGGEMVTETLADLYLSQGLAERAATLYRQLLVMRPGDPRLLARLEQALAAPPPQNGQPSGARAEGPGPEPTADATGGAVSVTEPAVASQSDEDAGAAAPDATDVAAPDAADAELAHLAEVEAAWTGADAAGGTESVSPYTWQEEAGSAERDRPAEPTILSYFERLMDWEPSEPSPAPADPPAARPATPIDEFDSLFTPAAPAEALPRETPTAPPQEAGPGPTAVAEAPEPTAASGTLVGLADLLVGLLEYKDPALPGGSSLIRQVATAIGRELGMADPPLRSLALAAVLQGIGRLALRQRPGEEDDATAEANARALEVTLELLDGLDLPAGVRDAVAHTNHRWDGADGAQPAGTAIPLPARILAVARDFAALLAPSTVEHSRRVGAALDELRREAGRRYDPAVINVLVRLVGSQARVGFGLRHHVILVHRRSPTAAVLAARLRSSGYLPEAVDDVARAWERLSTAPADALLLADDVTETDVPRFLTRLREDPRLGGIPVIVAGAGALDRRIELLNAGADICFPADVSFNELRATLTALLRRATRPGAAAEAARKAVEHARRYALQGDLVDFPLTWLLDILAFDGRTAVISVGTPDDEGTVHVERGVPRHAETRSRYGEAALRAMLRWRHGSFSVHLDAPPVPHTIHRSVMELLVADGLAQDGEPGSPARD